MGKPGAEAEEKKVAEACGKSPIDEINDLLQNYRDDYEKIEKNEEGLNKDLRLGNCLESGLLFYFIFLFVWTMLFLKPNSLSLSALSRKLKSGWGFFFFFRGRPGTFQFQF